jgi:NADH dehydrogenase
VKHKNIILLGGSGFVGKHLAIELAQRGYNVTLPCRRPHRLNELKVLPSITVIKANIMDQAELTSICKGHDAVFNLVGILNESGKNTFRKMHIDFVKSIVKSCQTDNIKRLLHISALGANQASGGSLYLRTKGEGENLLHTFGQNKLQVTSFQPSVIFGSDDSFINRFSGILKLSKGVFPLACPGSRFSPVFIGDTVSAMADTIDDPASFSRRYPLCGPETLTLLQIVEFIKQAQQSKCKIVGLPNTLAKLQAVILQNLPGKLFTMDNYRSLQTPSTCENGVPTCTTSFSSYIKGLPHLFSRRPTYDELRKQLNGK